MTKKHMTLGERETSHVLLKAAKWSKEIIKEESGPSIIQG